MDALFKTGYPHPINLFVLLMLTLLPALSPLSLPVQDLRPWYSYLAAGALSLGTLVLWSRIPVWGVGRSPRFHQGYLVLQTVLVSFIYILDGGLTRFLFVVVAVQAVYLTPARRWAPYLGTLVALWLTLFLVFAPDDPGSNPVAIIGMYLCYLVFAALVTLTTVQQERKAKHAQDLLAGVDARFQTLQAYDQTLERRTEMDERERLANTIHAELVGRLGALQDRLARITEGQVQLTQPLARELRLEAKSVLASVRDAVRTLRPTSDNLAEDEPYEDIDPQPEGPHWADRLPDPVRMYHVWNIGVIVVTTGVMLASSVVAGNNRWFEVLGLGLALLAAYGCSAVARQPWNRTLYLVLQAGLIIALIWQSEEPLMSHLFLIVAAQIIFLVPLINRWLLGAVIFPTLLAGASLWATRVFEGKPGLLISWTTAFGVTYFFGAAFAFMTRRQVETSYRATIYAEQLEEVNRLLEARLEEVRRLAIARERVRMARELHDGLGHHLTIVIMELQFAEQLADEDQPAATHHMKGAQQVIAAAMTASHEMVQTLDRFDRPLPTALEELVAAWQQRNNVAVSLRVVGDLGTLSTGARTTVYRAVQESLTNIQKHTSARRVQILLQGLSDRVVLTVVNDETAGKREEPPVITGGFGLIGLRERAEALHGEFQAQPTLDGGFRVKLVLPRGA